jgi:NAD(P)H-nitrite reductase large subunit
MSRHLILGSGVAGISAVEAIRSRDSASEIMMVSDDPYGYYSRPGLAYYLTGELGEKQLYPFVQPDYQRLKVNIIKGRVTKILRDERLLELDGKSRLGYDRLLIAVGAQAVRLNVPGAELEGVVKLDHLGDARSIYKLAGKRKRAIVVGGGITALELVEGLVARGVRVTYLLRGDRYWSNVLDEQESHIIERRLRDEGVTLEFHTELVEVLEKRGQVMGVRLQNGRTIPCNLLAYAIGIQPRLELARDAGLSVERGILVNEMLQTNDSAIFAAGDVAQVYDPRSGRAILDSLWGPAREQGWAAGFNMAGGQTPYIKPPPFNVTRLAGLTTTIIGSVNRGGRDEDLVGIARGDSETFRGIPDAISTDSGFSVNRIRLMVGDKNLLGAVVMGDQALSIPLQKMITGAADISPIRDRLLMPGAKLADVLINYWKDWNGKQ